MRLSVDRKPRNSIFQTGESEDGSVSWKYTGDERESEGERQGNGPERRKTRGEINKGKGSKKRKKNRVV